MKARILIRDHPKQMVKEQINRSVREIKYPFERNVGCVGSGNSRCQVCRDVKVTDIFDSFTTKKSDRTNYKFNCNEK